MSNTIKANIINGVIRADISSGNTVRVNVTSPTVKTTTTQNVIRATIKGVGPQGPTGPTGATGPAGSDGNDGAGVATGGTTGQVLTKASNGDFDTEWTNVSAGVSDWGDIQGTLSNQTDLQNTLDTKAPKASPTFTGTVTLPTGLTGVIRADSGIVSTDTDVTDIVIAASDTAAGKVELATIAETTTGTDATRAVTPDGLHDMTSLAGAAWFLDEDDMSTNSSTKVPSQQSVKAYVDANITSGSVDTANSPNANEFARFTSANTIEGRTVSEARSDLGVQTKVFYTVGSSDADYIIDGTDDDVQIQQALDAAETAGGGIVHIKEGQYDISAELTIGDNITLEGDGASTILLANASLPHTDNVIENNDTASGNANITITNLKIDGNYTNRTQTTGDETGHNIMFKNCNDCVVRNIWSDNGISSNICLAQGCNDCIIEGNITDTSYLHNILLVGTTGGATCKGNTVSNNVCYEAGQGGTGVGIELAKNATNNTITGNVCRNSAEGGIHVFYHSNKNTIAGNSILDTDQNGISIVDESDYNVVTGNVIDSPAEVGIAGTTAFLTYGGKFTVISNNLILNCGYNGIRGTYVGAQIINNYIDNCGASGTSNQTYSIYLTTISDSKIDGNLITNSANRAIDIVDITSSTVSSNTIISPGAQGIFFDYSSTGAVDCVVNGNYIEDTESQGIIFIRNAQRNTISNNVIKTVGSSGSGIDLRGTTYCSVNGNFISGCAAFGIRLVNDAASTGATWNALTGNTCTSNTSGGIQESGAADNNLIIGNNVNNNTTANLTVSGSSTIAFNNLGASTNKVRGTTTPLTSDGGALGTTALQWSDLFIASGGVLNFANGNATLTHSSGLLTSNVDVVVPTEVYGSGWDGSNEVPTKDAVYDKIESLSAGNLADDDYGDITVSSSGTIFTIDNGAVTYAKIQDVSATDKILGRVTAGAGNIEEITFTDFAQSLADDADATTARSTLGLGSAAVVATDLADLNESTIEAAIDTLANLTSIQGRTVTLADAGADAILGWDDSANAYENLTQAEVLAIIGNGAADGATKGVVGFNSSNFSASSGIINTSQSINTGASPQFAGVNVGHASDTTISRSSAGIIAVEGVAVPLNSITNTHTAQQIELGHASDTTLTRASAGVLAVEGVNVLTVAGGTITGNLVTNGGVIFNENGNAEFSRFEGDTDQNLLYVDGTNDRVGVGTSSPGSKFTVNGTAEATALKATGNIVINPSPSSDHTSSGVVIDLVANEAQNFGDVCYINASGEAQLADADGIATAAVSVMCVSSSVSADATGSYMLMGIARDDTWAWTVGGLIYLSLTGTTGNTLTQTAPSATDDCVVVVGVATHADRMIFRPSQQGIVEVV